MRRAWRLDKRGENKGELLPLFSQYPRTKEEVEAIALTEAEILEEKMKGAPEVIIGLAITGGLVIVKVQGLPAVALAAEMLGIPGIIGMSSLKLGLVTAGSILAGGSLIALAYFASQALKEEDRLARARMDLANLEKLQNRSESALNKIQTHDERPPHFLK